MKNKMKSYSMILMASLCLCLLLGAAQSAGAQVTANPPNPNPPKPQVPNVPKPKPFAPAKVKVIINFNEDKGNYENGLLGACSEVSVRVDYLVEANNKQVSKQLKANATGPSKMAKSGECTALITIPPFITYALSANFKGVDTYYGDLSVKEASKPGETAVYTLTLGHYKP